MEQRTFAETNEKVSLLGFGLMRLPRLNPDKPDIDEVLAANMLDYAYRHGVNYFDTAYPYHEGLSERFVGKALSKYPRESFFLADKMPIWEVEGGKSAESIFEEQLEKCNVEYFDFYLCHAMNRDRIEALTKYGIYAYLSEQKKSGRIRHLGFSFHDSPEVLEQLLSSFEFDFVQLQLNYLDWEMQDAKKQYEICKAHGKQVIIMEPCRGGTLADLGDDVNAIFKRARGDKSVPSWAFRYAGSLENVLCVLSGMTVMEHVIDNVSTFENFEPLTDGDRKTIDEALSLYRKTVIVPCTGCRYCMDCPMGVDIPAVFRIYNRSKFTHRDGLLKEELDRLEEGKRPNHCISCRKCMKHCPQKIEIPVRMAEIEKLYRKN
ncbi:MAG: aldo/keto reductase [Clostridia bacterium]|nr:aldo/keto reductase [Clostridia bacterium]